MTRYVFVGAGAVGGALGGLFDHQGLDVLLVARGEQARVLADRGLTLRCPDTTLRVRPPVVTAPEQAHLTVDDVLVFSTKTHQVEAALDAWADTPVHDGGGAVVGRAADVLPVFTALNGVAAEDIALRYAERVFGVCVWFPTVMVEPGEIFVRGAPLRGVFHVGRYGDAPGDADRALLDGVARDWGSAACPVVQPVAVMEWKYRKLLTNLGNALQALLPDGTRSGDLRRAVEAEALSALGAAGVAVTGDEEAAAGWHPDGLEFLPIPGEPAQLGGSTWQSLARGAGSVETDYLNGEITLIARRIGVPAPLNARLTALVREAARTHTPPGALTLDDLTARLGR